MTRGDRIKQWPIEKIIKWLILIERNAIKNAHKLGAMSDEDLAKDWYEFLTEEDSNACDT